MELWSKSRPVILETVQQKEIEKLAMEKEEASWVTVRRGRRTALQKYLTLMIQSVILSSAEPRPFAGVGKPASIISFILLVQGREVVL